ncbi:MAG: hypothetical protein FJ291_19185 [Planctomycetes bacterium]|nr:hypothetical protein [Planctomycetota bacterium]
MFAALNGCVYLQHRGDDAVDMADIGLTWSLDPAFALYSNTPVLVPIGWSEVDGYVAGIGGGEIGMTSHYEKCIGLILWGQEEIGWHHYDLKDPRTINLQGVGPIAPMVGPFGDAAFVPAWTNYIHLGWGGIIFNARYVEMLDFLLGWFGADIARDDGKATGQWPWEDRPRPRNPLAPAPPK